MHHTTLQSAPSTTSAMPTKNRAVAAASVGNVLEIYDFIAYGIFAIPISRTFFPGSELNALILTFMTFAAGFLARPVGAWLLGRYADNHGRKKALSLTLLLMAVGTTVPALCPGYASIGIAAPVIMVIGRLLQGFSAGGEIGGVIAMLVENAPPARKNLYASFQQASQGVGIFLAGFVGFLLTTLFTEQAMLDGAWRYAFFFGLLIGPVGWYIRQSIAETPEFEAARSRPVVKTSIGRTLAANWLSLVAGLSIMAFWTVSTYITNFMTTFAVRELKLDLQDSYIALMCNALALLVAAPLAARVADRVGSHKTMLFGAGLTALLAYPMFWFLISHTGLMTLAALQIVLGLLLGCYGASASTFLSGLFPTQFRVTGVNVAYAVGVALFGGFTPAIVTALIAASGDKLVVSYYLVAAALISSIGILVFHRRARHLYTGPAA